MQHEKEENQIKEAKKYMILIIMAVWREKKSVLQCSVGK